MCRDCFRIRIRIKGWGEQSVEVFEQADEYIIKRDEASSQMQIFKNPNCPKCSNSLKLINKLQKSEITLKVLLQEVQDKNQVVIVPVIISGSGMIRDEPVFLQSLKEQAGEIESLIGIRQSLRALTQKFDKQYEIIEANKTTKQD